MIKNSANTLSAQRRRSMWVQVFHNRYMYLMFLPALVLLLIFSYYPMYGIILAFKNFEFSKGILFSSWADNHGMYNFIRVFRNPQFKPDGTKMSMNDRYKSVGLNGLACWSGYFVNENPAGNPVLMNMAKEAVNYAVNTQDAKPAVLPDTFGLVLVESADYDTAGADFKKILNDIMIADDVAAKWQETVDNLMKSGYDKVVAEMNILYKATGR